MAEKIDFISEIMNNAAAWSPKQTLIKAIEDLEKGNIKANKLAVLFLDDEDEGYAPAFYQSGMRMSEFLALIEAIKPTILQEMELL